MSDDGLNLPPLEGPNLSLVSLEDLIEEIRRRADTAVILLLMEDERTRGSCSWSGNYYTAMGLLESYKNDLIHLDLQNAQAGDEL